VAKLNNE